MKTVRRISLLCGLLTVLSPGFSWSQEIDCRMVADNVRKMIESAPNHTLTVVEDALVAAPGCVCEIVKTAITASNADGDLVKKIVYTAVKTTQQSAPIIAECAVAAAPQHADSVRAAFAEAFEDAPKTTKKPKPTKPVEVAVAEKPKPVPQPASQSAPQSVPRMQQPASQPRTDGYQPLEIVLAETATGKQVVEFAPQYAYDPKGIVVEDEVQVEEAWTDWDQPYEYPPGITFFGGPPIDFSGLYLYPPIASAPPIISEEREHDTEVRSRSVNRTTPPRTTSIRRNPPKPPKPPVTSKPMSPTGA